jgi:hypothetical protein
MKFEWDDNKNLINIKKHGLSFELAEAVFLDEFCLELYDEEHSSLEEDRFIAIGMLQNQIVIVTVVYTERDDVIRIISARKATDIERKYYYESAYS